MSKEYFIQFAPQTTIPSLTMYAVSYLNPGNIKTSRMCLYTPIPIKSKCTRFRVVTRGKWPQSLISSAYIRASIIKNGKIVPGGIINFEALFNIGVITRHKTIYPNIEFQNTDTVGIFIETHYMSELVVSQYLSAILNFE